MPIADSISMEIDQEAKITQRVFDRVPEDKLAWKPHAKVIFTRPTGVAYRTCSGIS